MRPGPRRCSWPTNSSSVRGRMRAANGAVSPSRCFRRCSNRVWSPRFAGMVTLLGTSLAREPDSDRSATGGRTMRDPLAVFIEVVDRRGPNPWSPRLAHGNVGNGQEWAGNCPEWRNRLGANCTGLRVDGKTKWAILSHFEPFARVSQGPDAGGRLPAGSGQWGQRRGLEVGLATGQCRTSVIAGRRGGNDGSGARPSPVEALR